MASQEVITYYQSWLREKKRAIKYGKPNYEANCDIEITRLESENPELLDNKQEWMDAIVDY